MPLGTGKGQWCVYYFASRCKAAWRAFEDHQDEWGNVPQQHHWWTMGLRLEGVRLFVFCRLKTYLTLDTRTDLLSQLVIMLLRAL